MIHGLLHSIDSLLVYTKLLSMPNANIIIYGVRVRKSNSSLLTQAIEFYLHWIDCAIWFSSFAKFDSEYSDSWK